jgi:LmbE family N-acetylglucosaminyl deacetylase
MGCGGTILKLIETYKNSFFYWVVLSSDNKRAQEALESAHSFLKHAKKKKIIIKNFRDGFFPYIGSEIKEYFEQLKKEYSPDIVFTHYRNDLHQDHRVISDLTWNTYRNHFILEYEIPKYDGDLGSPNLFFHLNESISQKKIEYILQSFKTQHENSWFSKETFLSILRIRGIESNAQSKYAEAFYCRKVVF